MYRKTAQVDLSQTLTPAELDGNFNLLVAYFKQQDWSGYSVYFADPHPAPIVEVLQENKKISFLLMRNNESLYGRNRVVMSVEHRDHENTATYLDRITQEGAVCTKIYEALRAAETLLSPDAKNIQGRKGCGGIEDQAVFQGLDSPYGNDLLQYVLLAFEAVKIVDNHAVIDEAAMTKTIAQWKAKPPVLNPRTIGFQDRQTQRQLAL